MRRFTALRWRFAMRATTHDRDLATPREIVNVEIGSEVYREGGCSIGGSAVVAGVRSAATEMTTVEGMIGQMVRR